MRPLNSFVRDAGVVWHPCTLCKTDWPFPKGLQADREWQCCVCTYAAWAKLQRDQAQAEAVEEAVGGLSVEKLVATIFEHGEPIVDGGVCADYCRMCYVDGVATWVNGTRRVEVKHKSDCAWQMAVTFRDR